MKSTKLFLLCTMLSCSALQHLQASSEQENILNEFTESIACDNREKINQLWLRVNELTLEDRGVVKKRLADKVKEYENYIHGLQTIIIPTLKKINPNHPNIAFELKIQEEQIKIHGHYHKLSTQLTQKLS
jgi:hypothetical protein